MTNILILDAKICEHSLKIKYLYLPTSLGFDESSNGCNLMINTTNINDQSSKKIKFWK